MAYAQNVNPAQPLGSSLDAADIDGEFRRFKAALEERLTGTLFQNWQADPLVVIPAKAKGDRYNIDFSAFWFNKDPESINDAYIEFKEDGVVGYAPLVVPDGVELTGFLVYYRRVEGGLGTATGRLDLLYGNYTSPTLSALGSATGLTGTGNPNDALVTFSHVVSNGDNKYKLKFSLSNVSASDTFRFFGVSVLFGPET